MDWDKYPSEKYLKTSADSSLEKDLAICLNSLKSSNESNPKVANKPNNKHKAVIEELWEKTDDDEDNDDLLWIEDSFNKSDFKTISSSPVNNQEIKPNDIIENNEKPLNRSIGTEKCKNKYIGMVNTMNCGLKAEIIDYKNCDDATIKFENGLIKEHVRVDKFKEGKVAPPTE